jgi:cAMP-dependent protein kinase regulator/CRP/FNR family cyclic AMP-dependent transcriptional regulator/cGMP-dependent protein kinase 2
VDQVESVDLESIPLFAGLAPEDRAHAAAVARHLEWDVGHVVVKEGEYAFDFYAIKQGIAEVRRGGQRVAVLGAGDFFGELGVVRHDSLRPSRRRSASVVVTAPTEAIGIAGDDIRRLAEDIPKLRDALRNAAAERSQPETS